jgi:hypothetical protein
METTMGLFDVFSGWRRQRERKRDIQATAHAILTRYHMGKRQGRLRVDDQLLADIQRHMPAGVAIRIFQDFRTRRAHEHPQADGMLLHDIVQAMYDVEHFAKATKPIRGAADPPMRWRRVAGMSLEEIAYTKIVAGQPLSEEEENALLRSGLKR